MCLCVCREGLRVRVCMCLAKLGKYVCIITQHTDTHTHTHTHTHRCWHWGRRRRSWKRSWPRSARTRSRRSLHLTSHKPTLVTNKFFFKKYQGTDFSEFLGGSRRSLHSASPWMVDFSSSVSRLKTNSKLSKASSRVFGESLRCVSVSVSVSVWVCVFVCVCMCVYIHVYV
jgi:hypothetical protein